MISVFFDYSLAFLVKPFVLRMSVTDVCPSCTSHQQINTCLVSLFDSHFGRAPGMEAHVVQSVVLACLVYFCPVGSIHGRIAREWKFATVQCSPQKNRSAVYFKMSAFGFEFPQSEIEALHVFASIAGYYQTIDCRIVFRPQLSFFAQSQVNIGILLSFGNLQGDGRTDCISLQIFYLKANREILLCRIRESEVGLDAFVLYIRSNDHMINIIFIYQNLSDEAVPVGLCMVRNTMCIPAYIYQHSVVYSDGQDMLSCFEFRQ